MLIIRLKNGVTINLERSVGSSGKYGLWEFHRSANSYMRPPDYTPFRHAALLPAEPGESQTVTVAISRPGLPEADWIQVGEGVATYDVDR
ncbi:bacteriophage protein [Pseudomonas luteola]|uniref:Bacteriophage protein n=2 Tax=Pseudomonas TaxID=286 RepID=A0A2X2C9T4_PSELU|nr:hypothetical protein [Pseudomonas luteola]MCG7374174.1 hypothetical protein [Pseudomonas luteola]SER47103.1 hypothetical protein SAMN05216409_12520 [Pseudomonas lutea]SPZ05322.1 bacteriophage protein [Pseudomonas luteola]